ncbi:MAG TPA: DUF4190 domain-containing protein [Sandaracinaceae bacterium LLY-WYZ-13_1]|nr:DUF4190 domain-containing protein [Sandaracinaceae bacterium LLY-WYZ-13_1]
MEANAEPRTPAGASCHQHADAAAVGTCDRCGVYVCAACRRFYDYVPLCSDCYDRRSHAAPASPRARWSVLLAILGVAFVVIPFGIPAVFLAHTELAAIERGQASAGGRGTARAAVLLGWIANFLFFVISLVIGTLVYFLVLASEPL